MIKTASNVQSGKSLTSALGLAVVLSFALPLAGAGAADLKSRSPATELGFKSKGGGAQPDFQCGSSSTPACDDAFATKCKEAGGTLSEKLPFGGKTCTTPGGW
jgi:hypothetical protein